MSGQIVVEIRLLGKKADLRLYQGVSPFAAQNSRRTRGGKYQPHQQFQSCGFARAVGAQEAENLTVLNRELQRVQGALRTLAPEPYAVSFFQSQYFYGRHDGDTVVARRIFLMFPTKNYMQIQVGVKPPHRATHYESKSLCRGGFSRPGRINYSSRSGPCIVRSCRQS